MVCPEPFSSSSSSWELSESSSEEDDGDDALHYVGKAVYEDASVFKA